MAEVVMPRLSDSMEEGTILQWLKQLGDEVAVGDELVEIETDKANMAYESDVAGTLTEILVQEGETLPIGTPIARVGDAARDRAQHRPRVLSPQGTHRPLRSLKRPRGRYPLRRHPRTKRAKLPGLPTEAGVRKRHRWLGGSPRSRGVDLAQLEGSGPGGRIVKADVENEPLPGARTGTEHGPAPATQDQPPETATRGRSSWSRDRQGAGHLRRPLEAAVDDLPADGGVEGDCAALLPRGRDRHEPAVAARAQIKASAQEGDVVPSFNDMVVKACALALREHPRANGAYRDGRFELYSRVNVGHRRGGPGRARRAHRVRCRPEGPAADRHRLAGAGAAGAGRADHAAGALGRDLHRLQPGDVRDRQLRRGDQPAAGGDPRRRRDHRAPRRPRRPDRPPPT